MNVFLTNAGETELVAMLRERATLSTTHTLVDDPADAEMILITGSFGRDPHFLLEHPLYKQYPDKCATFTEDDNYLPLLPGVYCSAHNDESARVGRVFSYTYVSRNGLYKNPFLAETAEADAAAKRAATSAEGKRFLFSFQGGSTSMLRKSLFNIDFKRDDVLIENTSNYYHWDNSQPGREDRQKRYAETLATSNFVLCPRGAGVGSIRFFEVMAAGIAPVLLADDYALPPDIDWDRFLIRVKESDLQRLPELIEPYLATATERGRLAREAFEQNFRYVLEFDRIIELASRALRHGGPSETTFRAMQTKLIRQRRRKEKLRAFAKAAFLKTLKVLHLKNPYQMNR